MNCSPAPITPPSTQDTGPELLSERVLLYHRLARELSTGLGFCSTQAHVELGIAEKPKISENRAQMDGDDVFWFVDGVFEEPEDDEVGPEADEILLSWSEHTDTFRLCFVTLSQAFQP